MKNLFILFVMVSLYSCKQENTNKRSYEAVSKNDIVIPQKDSLHKVSTAVIQEIAQENCYDYLTELVRSSDFPFSEWKIERNKVNLLIDNQEADSISCRLFYDTEGSGTIGWIKYNTKDGILMNTSANLENPVTLQYDSKWKALFDQCSSKK
ncbi:hypothetical protein SAMN05443633_10840 [Chryseobacterium arachidis]|uniref:Lipoprotein n=3 Tax=Chryseobacterium arachidis TaxID=1416778 RepID=A0A1M5FJE8_9FLAO|nr:hypothetical protein [Chryseobacterium arachidis]SHF91616.1 hypothetical protein SAMN05443633_10840 [Chryseobacterium arachidis]